MATEHIYNQTEQLRGGFKYPAGFPVKMMHVCIKITRGSVFFNPGSSGRGQERGLKISKEMTALVLLQYHYSAHSVHFAPSKK